MAYFYTARLHSKMTAVDPKAKLADLSAALDSYRSMVVCADKHIRAQKVPLDLVEGAEISIARDMLLLLPVQIGKLTAVLDA